MRECSLHFCKIYFSETGYDPCEWGAKLEDRYYNNHAFNVSLTIWWSSSPLQCAQTQAKIDRTPGGGDQG